MDGELDSVTNPKEEPKVALHKRGLERYRLLEEAWAENRKLALDDIKFRAGDHWPEAIKLARSKMGQERPMLVVDKLNQYVRQVVNDARQNRPAVKIRPIDDEGDVQVAEAYQGIIRHICDRSNASLAFDGSTEDAVVGGYGYYRVTTEYAHAKTFNQELCIEKIGNPLSVLLGIPGEQPLKCKDGFVVDEMPKAEFKETYPDAKYTDWDADSNKYSTGWTHGENIRYCEWFYKEDVKTTMHLLADGTTVSDEDYQESVKELGQENCPAIQESREIPQPVVKWCRMSGAEVLEESEWLGKYIPLIRVVGNEYNIEGKVIYSGLIRAAKDPQRLYNYSRSAFAERVALTPKSPWIAEEGQVEDYEDEWKASNTGNIALLKYKKQSLDGGQPVPPPQRVSASDIPEGFARDMTLSEHDIQASMGMYAASVGQPSNERSGKAIMARQHQGDTATFHYQDNASRGIHDLGVILVDLIPEIYDSKRAMRILGEDGTSTTAEHDPEQQEPVTKMGSKVIYNLGIGTYDISIESGPSFATRRVEQSEAMMELVHNSPEAMQIAGDLLVKSQDWPGAQELAERYRLMLPAPIQQALQAKQDGLPPEAQAIIAQAHQAMQQSQQQIQQMGQELQKIQSELAMTKDKASADHAKAVVDHAHQVIENYKKENEILQKQRELEAAQTGADGKPNEFVMTENGAIPFEQWKALLDADTKVAVAEIGAKTQIKTAAMSANTKPGDGTTTLDDTGTPQASSGLSALVDSVNANMAGLINTHQAIAEGLHHVAIASKLPRKAVRDAQGNLTSQVVQ